MSANNNLFGALDRFTQRRPLSDISQFTGSLSPTDMVTFLKDEGQGVYTNKRMNAWDFAIALNNLSNVTSQFVAAQFEYPTTLSVDTNFGYFRAPHALRLITMSAYAAGPPDGSALSVDAVRTATDTRVNANSSQGITVADGESTAFLDLSGQPVIDFAEGEEINMRTISVGSTDPGAFLYLRATFIKLN